VLAVHVLILESMAKIMQITKTNFVRYEFKIDYLCAKIA